MTPDAGLAEIADRFNPAAGGAGVAAEGSAELTVMLGGLLTEMKLERQRRAWFEQKMAQAIRDTPLVSVSAVAGTPATFASDDWVCKTGWAWYLQLATAKNLGSTDTVWVYRTSGSGVQQVVDSAAKWPLTNASPAWHPGRTGLRLAPGDGITLQGTTTNTVTVNLDVIMVEAWIEADFLL